MPENPSAERFVEELEACRSSVQQEKDRRYFKTGEGQYAEGDVFIGVRMGQIFALAKEFIEMLPEEIEMLLENEAHETRAGALSIMDKQGHSKKTPESRRKELFDLGLRPTDKIDNWDLVDLGAPHVIGRYLFDRPRDVHYELAHSESSWERRTAIVSTSHFISQGCVVDTFRIAEMLLGDKHDLIHKPTGGWVHEAEKGSPTATKLLGKTCRHRTTYGAGLRNQTPQ